MPPSNVFSYWRRRSSNASPAPTLQPTSKGPPQLPQIADLTANFDEKFTAAEGPTAQGSQDHLSNSDGGKFRISASAIIEEPSSTTAATAPTSAEDDTRPPSSSEGRDREPSTLTSPLNNPRSHTSPGTPDQIPSHSKPSTPSRTSSGKDRLNPLAVDGQPRRSISPGMAPSGHRRFRTSPDVSPGSNISSSQKEHRFEGPTSRRQTERDVQSGEPVPPKSGKTMLHLLNPMALLAKRRSHQIAGLRPEDVNKGTRSVVPAIPDDYDPRIRGNIVHDFSAPRPRRQVSSAAVLRREQIGPSGSSDAAIYELPGDEPKVTNNDQKSPYSPPSDSSKKHSDHSPVFTEHFEDDKRALQVESKAYLQSPLLTDPANRDRDSHSLPVFARKLPSSITDHEKLPVDLPKSSPEAEVADDSASNVGEDSDTIEAEVPPQTFGLPKHFKSNASRFSFDMSGVGSSTQEKLLEEKHKEKEAARKAEARLNGEFSDLEDDYDNDMFDDMDGLEEEIPGVNVADDDDEFKDFSGPGNVWNKSWLAPNLSPVVASPVQPEVSTSQGQSEVSSSQVDHLHSSKQEGPNQSEELLSPEGSIPPDDVSESSKTFLRESTDLSNIPLQTIPDEDDMYFDDGEFGDLETEKADDKFDESIFDDPASPLYDRKQPPASVQSQSNAVGEASSMPLRTIPDEDDLYFDDGEFGELDAQGTGNQFDESIFDDPSSHLYERKQPTAQVQPQHAESISGPDSVDGLKHASSTASDYHQGFAPRRYGSVAGNMPNPELANSHSGILSEHNLEAFHSALANAANLSASKGHLEHTASISERSMAQESALTTDSQPGLVSDESRVSQAMDMVSFDEVFEDFNYDDNDDSLYDDPIIAAANAEALTMDDEGVYGHEFGFYAQAYGTGTGSELTNGGYFGPRGAEGISRSHSGLNKLREPLTPITEYSGDWSARNSIYSVTAHGVAHSNQSVSSPGLAQLVDLNNLDDEMSLSALMKLRRDAWGGSNGSLRSSSASPPPQQQQSSNRASLALSDVSPTVNSIPPDFLGGAFATESPIRETDKGAWAYPPQQRADQPATGEREP
ncbi:hypothetical protein BDV18DRAFT_134688 [Aspergillus unguis]